MSSLKEMRSLLDQKKGQKEIIENDYDILEKKIKQNKKEVKYSEKALLIIQKVAKETQEELEYHISELVTLALSAVFDDPYEFKTSFVIRRGKTECDMYFEKDGQQFDPLTSVGGGVVDVACFALRIAVWSLSIRKSNNVLIFDEPFRFLSKKLQPKASNMLKQISEKLNLQIIMVSHSQELIDGADKVYVVDYKRGVSKVREE